MAKKLSKDTEIKSSNPSVVASSRIMKAHSTKSWCRMHKEKSTTACKGNKSILK